MRLLWFTLIFLKQPFNKSFKCWLIKNEIFWFSSLWRVFSFLVADTEIFFQLLRVNQWIVDIVYLGLWGETFIGCFLFSHEIRWIDRHRVKKYTEWLYSNICNISNYFIGLPFQLYRTHHPRIVFFSHSTVYVSFSMSSANMIIDMINNNNHLNIIYLANMKDFRYANRKTDDIPPFLMMSAVTDDYHLGFKIVSVEK